MKRINLNIDERLLDRVDQLAERRYMSRSEYIRQVLLEVVEASEPKILVK